MKRGEVISYAGLAMTLKQWAKHLDIEYKTLWMRFRDGMTMEKALQRTVQRTKTKRNPSKTVEKKCVACGSVFVIPKCRDWRESCCSSECKTAYRATQRAEEIASRTRQCMACGKNFTARKTQIEAGGGKYCCSACQREHQAVSFHTAEARAKAVISRRASLAQGKWKIPLGADNPNWRGGRQARLARQATPEKLEMRRKLRRQYLKQNPEKAREWARRRRGHGKLPPGTVSKLFTLQRGRCACCRSKLGDNFHLDHIQPLAKGGKHEKQNVQLLCPPCNLRKSARDPITFMQSNGFLL